MAVQDEHYMIIYNHKTDGSITYRASYNYYKCQCIKESPLSVKPKSLCKFPGIVQFYLTIAGAGYKRADGGKHGVATKNKQRKEAGEQNERGHGLSRTV